MSADNYVVVDHDGENFLVGMGFMSSDEGPQGWVKCESVADVMRKIKSYYVIEYGVEWTAAAMHARADIDRNNEVKDYEHTCLFCKRFYFNLGNDFNEGEVSCRDGHFYYFPNLLPKRQAWRDVIGTGLTCKDFRSVNDD